MNIREHTASDIRLISLLYFNTVHKVNSRDYSPEQIRAWVPEIPPAGFWQQRFQTRSVLVAEESEDIVGFAEFQNDGHIDCFYVHHLYQGRGIGTALMQAVEKRLLDKNTSRLFAEVSLTAVPFFSSRGFTVKEERISEFRNAQFVLKLMEKYLQPGERDET